MSKNDFKDLLGDMRQHYGDERLMLLLADWAGYSEVPVTIDQFIDDPYYAGTFLGSNLYPAWREELRRIYPDNFTSPYSQIIATGAIGLGKTTLCLTGLLYTTHKLLCLRDLHKTFQLVPSTKIVVAFMNTTLRAADSVLYSQFVDWLKESPYFREQMAKVKQIKNSNKVRLPHNIELFCGSRGTMAMGRAIVAGVLSELNHQGEQKKTQAKEQYDNVKRRIDSRFMREEGLIIPGQLWLDSSKSDETGFLENHIKDSLSDPRSLVISKAVWEVMESAGKVRYSGAKFGCFIGDENRDPFLLSGPRTDYKLPPELILEVPVEYRKSFEQDIFGSLRDLAGVSTWSTFKFFPQPQKVRDCLTLANPCHKQTIELSFKDPADRLINYFDLTKIDKSGGWFLHLDLGLKHDATGLAMTKNAGEVVIDRTNAMLETNTVADFVYHTALAVAIRPKPGEELSLAKLKQFIMDLRQAGYHLAKITADSYQSANLLQDFSNAGFATELLSVDRTRNPYDFLKNAVLEKRWKAPASNSVLETELLELLDLGTKIDHPTGGNTSKPGTKDVADAVAGSLFSCGQQRGSQHAFQALKSYVESAKQTNAKEPVLKDPLRAKFEQMQRQAKRSKNWHMSGQNPKVLRDEISQFRSKPRNWYADGFVEY